MKARRFGAWVICVCGTAAAVAQTPVSTAFTYQGRLNIGGAPATGQYDFVFRLYDAVTNGVQYDVQTVNDLTVTGGLFTTKINFGAGGFSADARWLQIEVRPGSSTGAYTVLTPRQEFTATPWAHAIRLPYSAQTSGSGTAFNLSQLGTGKTAQFNGSATGTQPVLSASSTGTSSGADAGSFTKTGVGSAAAIAASAINGGDVLNLSYDDPGHAGQIMYAYSNSPSGYSIQNITGGGADNFYALNVGGAGDAIIAQQGGLFGSSGMGRAGYFAQNVSTNPSDAVEVEQDGTGDGIYAHIDNSSNSAYGVNALTVGTGRAGRFEVSNPSNTLSALLAVSNGNGGAFGASSTGAGRAGTFTISNASSSASALYCSTNGTGLAFEANGTARVKVLEITGADVAEKFPVTGNVRPGTVVMIDAANPGKLCQARGEYNRKVAGVVSGANDLPAGTILGHLPGSEDHPPIALSGRVWVACDATQSAIEVGDPLTTSDTPGAAMKAADMSRAQGATIGKAMTALAQGEKGLVLVLVNLQ